MKKAVAIAGAACLAGAAGAYDLPTWYDDHGTVKVEWTDAWSGFSLGGSMCSPDTYQAVDQSGTVLPGGVPGEDAPDATKTSATFHADAPFNYLEVTENWDLSFWFPTFAGETAQSGFLEVSYYDDPGDPDWRQGWTLGVTAWNPGGSSLLSGPPVLVGTAHDTVNGIITEAYSFDVTGVSPRGLFVDVAAAPELSLANPGQFVGFAAAANSFSAIPEPSTLTLLGGVALLGLRARRNGIVRHWLGLDR